MTEKHIIEQLNNWVTDFGRKTVEHACKEFLRAPKRKSSASTTRKSVPKSWILILINRQDNECPRCKIQFEEGDKIVFDHIIPLVRGGEHSIDNGAALHEKCNLYKGANSLEEEAKASNRTVAEIFNNA